MRLKVSKIIEITKSFNSGSLQEKKNIFSTLSKNFTLKDGILAVELETWLQVIKTEYPKLVREFRRLEPTKKDTSSELLSAFDSKKFKWGNLVSLVRTEIEKDNFVMRY